MKKDILMKFQITNKLQTPNFRCFILVINIICSLLFGVGGLEFLDAGFK